MALRDSPRSSTSEHGGNPQYAGLRSAPAVWTGQDQPILPKSFWNSWSAFGDSRSRPGSMPLRSHGSCLSDRARMLQQRNIKNQWPN